MSRFGQNFCMTFQFYMIAFGIIAVLFVFVLTSILIARYNNKVLKKSFLSARIYIYVVSITAIFFVGTIFYSQYQSSNANIATAIYCGIFFFYAMIMLVVLNASLKMVTTVAHSATELAKGKKNLNVDFEGALEFESLSKSFDRVQEVYRQNDRKLNQKDNEYQKFVPKEYLKYFGAKKITDLKVGDYVQTKLSIMFCDMRNSYFASETLNLQDNFLLIKEFLGQVSTSVKKHNGFVDKYMGDGTLAIFDNSQDAYDCANEIAHKLDYKNLVSIGKEPIKFGISLGSGQCIVGVVGENKQKQFAVVSDTVNLCSRIEELNKIFGTRILMTKQFMGELSSQSSYRYVGTINFDDLTSTIPLFESLDAYDQSRKLEMSKTIQEFESGVRFYEKNDFDKAKQFFGLCIKNDSDDKLSKFYLTRTLEKLSSRLPVLGR